MVCLDTTQLTRPAESSAWHETSDDDACLALNFHTAEAKKGRLASLKTSIFGGTLHLGTHMPGLWERARRRTTTLTRRPCRELIADNLHHSIITALDSNRQACGVGVSCE